MTIFAGIYVRKTGRRLPEEAIQAIRKSISRSREFSVQEHTQDRYFLATVDIGAFPTGGIVAGPESGITVLAGDPLIKFNGKRRFSDRLADAKHINERLNADDVSVLAHASGTFAGVHINSDEDYFAVFTDKIGVRPVFICVTEEFIFFATALRILEQIPLVPKRFDTAAIIEEVALHWPLGRKTPYKDVVLLGSAEVMKARHGSPAIDVYWRWPMDKRDAIPLQEHLDECHTAFMAAIESRLTDEKEVLAFLSGGLDSRSVVGGLRLLGIRVDSLNFAPPNTQDQVFGRQFAEIIGTHHLEIEYNARIADPDQVTIAVSESIRESAAAGEITPPRTRCIWTGNGGSVGLGHVYMTERIVDKLQAGDYEGAIDAYMSNQGQGVPRRPLRNQAYLKYHDWPRNALIQEIRQTTAPEPGRSFYLFLMNNDQRRSLIPVYETIDLHGLEFILPFFDMEFLVSVFRVPLNECLYHRFYNDWLKQFPDAVSNTPWQSYPGHVPCPIPSDQDLAYQFSKDYSQSLREIRQRKRLEQAEKMLRSDRFPTSLLSRPTILAARLLCGFGSRRLGYAIDKGYKYFKYAEKTSEPIEI